MSETKTLTETKTWGRNAVRVVRAGEVDGAKTAAGGRATVFDFAGTEARQTWLGAANLAPGVATGLHHHGRHEVAFFVAAGHPEVRWGDQLEFAAQLGPGDWAYFPPYVPHQERNPSTTERVEFVVVRSDNERIAIKIDGPVADTPETVY